MTLPTLHAIERLLDRGATIVGARAAGSPSLADDARAVDAACDRIWSERRTSGRVIATSDLRAAFDELGMRPALEVDGAPIRQIARVIDGRRLTFLANPSAVPVEFRVLVDDPSRPLVAWDPVELRTESLPVDTTASDDDRVAYRVSFPAFGSVFVLPADERPPTASVVHSIPLEGAWELHLPGRPPMAMPDRPKLWTDVDDEARAFSGSGTYALGFTLTERQLGADRYVVDLADVRDIARVVVNDVDCGVAWTPPFRVDVTTALRAGDNAIEVEVVTPWRNRLIAEAGGSSGEVFEPMTAVFAASARPLPAGLAGPVSLIAESAP
jgi:hypothetical protein